MKLITWLVVAIAIVLGLVFLLNAYNYSIGTRTGTIDKISTKGFGCWTTEGQLALPNFSKSDTLGSAGKTMDNTFYFSIPDKEVQKQFEAIAPGSAVTVQYHQKMFPLSLPIPFFCVRRTQYEITSVTPAAAYAPPQIPMRP